MRPLSKISGSSIHSILDESELPADPTARQVRERYIEARFRQFLQPGHSLKDTSGVRRFARQLLDDEHPRLAAELLQLSLEENRSQLPLWLCLVELAYLGNDPAAFGELSDVIHQRFPDADALPVIESMGNKLLPSDPRFAHAVNPVILPDWSTPDSVLRDEVLQRKLHAALVEAMALYSPR